MLIHPMPDPVAFAIGPLKLHWYGLAYVAAFAQLLVLCRWRLKHPQIMAMKWSLQEVDSLLIYAAVGVFAGARLGEVLFYHPLYFLSHPLEIFQPWKGGMSFHGGLVGVLIMMWLWGRKYNRHPFDTLDFIAPMVPLGLMFGRLGNFINAELHGRVADPSLPWAMIWPNVDNLPRHPSPLYEALAEGLVFFHPAVAVFAQSQTALGGGGHVRLALRLRPLCLRIFPGAGLRRAFRRFFHFRRTNVVLADDRDQWRYFLAGVPQVQLCHG